MKQSVVTVCFMLMFYIPQPLPCQRLVPPGKNFQNDEDDYHPSYADDVDEEEYIAINNTDEKGLYVGSACEFTCSAKLAHVYCNAISGQCECEKKYPVKLNNPYAGCTKPRRLGDQCYYKEACKYTDQHSSCIQVHHKAVCQCQTGYHTVSLQKPSKRVFCAEDVVVLASDFTTFAGVLSGIAILSGLICFVLHLFNQNLYGSRHHRHRFGNANLAPPILFASDPGSLPLGMMAYERSVTATTASRASSTHRTYASMGSRRASSAPGFRTGAVGTAVAMSRAGAARTAAILLLSYCPLDHEVYGQSSRMAETKFMANAAGSRRPSIASVHSASSIRSYSARRYEKERLQKEEREIRLGRLSNSTNRVAPTPSPHSTDDLLPTLEEDKQIPPLATKEESTTSFAEELPSTSKQYP